MAKLDRKDVKIFAENSKETFITEFRTEDSVGVTASFSRDPDVIQNENYSQGWVNDTNNLNTKIYGEDLNAVNYVLSYLLKYLYENGIAEWKSTTTYYQNSICKVDNALYLSLQNNNIGNDPTSTVSYWKLIPLENVSIEDAGSGFSIVKDVTDNVITFKTISVTGYGEITDNGDQLNIDIAGGGGGGGGDAYWGTIKGTITNQTDLMALINLKQDIFTVDSPLVLTDEQHLTINKATSSVSGYLDYNDFNTFNGKQDTISATLPISITNNNIEIETADTSTTGALSYTDWNTFNNKQDKIQGVQFYYDDSILKQEPDSNRTSYLGSDLKPYNFIYGEQIGDSSEPVTHAFISRINSTSPIPLNSFAGFARIESNYSSTSFLTINGTTFSSLSRMSVYKDDFNFNSIIGVSNLYGNSYTCGCDDITITATHTDTKCVANCSFTLPRIRYTLSQSSTQIDTNINLYLSVVDTTSSTTNAIQESQIYKGMLLSGSVWQEEVYTGSFNDVVTLTKDHTYKIKAYFTIGFAGGSQYLTIQAISGVTRKGNLVLQKIES